MGGDNKNFKHKTSKIRMPSPKLRVIFRPKSEIQTFFPSKISWSPKKKVFTEIGSDFSAEIGNSNVFSVQNQLVSKKKRSSPKLKLIFRPKSLGLGWWGGMHPEMESDFSKWRLIFRPKSLVLGWWGVCIPPSLNPPLSRI